MEATLNRGLSLLVRCTLKEIFLYRAYMGTSLMRKRPPLGLSQGPRHRPHAFPYGMFFYYERGALVQEILANKGSFRFWVVRAG